MNEELARETAVRGTGGKAPTLGVAGRGRAQRRERSTSGSGRSPAHSSTCVVSSAGGSRAATWTGPMATPQSTSCPRPVDKLLAGPEPDQRRHRRRHAEHRHHTARYRLGSEPLVGRPAAGRAAPQPVRSSDGHRERQPHGRGSRRISSAKSAHATSWRSRRSGRGSGRVSSSTASCSRATAMSRRVEPHRRRARRGGVPLRAVRLPRRRSANAPAILRCCESGGRQRHDARGPRRRGGHR